MYFVKIFLFSNLIGNYLIFIGEDGFFQMALEDFFMFRSISGFIVFYSSDVVFIERVVELVVNIFGVCFIRISRFNCFIFYFLDDNLQIGKVRVYFFFCLFFDKILYCYGFQIIIFIEFLINVRCYDNLYRFNILIFLLIVSCINLRCIGIIQVLYFFFFKILKMFKILFCV